MQRNLPPPPLPRPNPNSHSPPVSLTPAGVSREVYGIESNFHAFAGAQLRRRLRQGLQRRTRRAMYLPDRPDAVSRSTASRPCHGAGSELLPLPLIISHSFLGTGIERLSEPDYEQLQGPASMAAVESMAAIEIGDCDVSSDAHCAVCKEAMAVGRRRGMCPAITGTTRNAYCRGSR